MTLQVTITCKPNEGYKLTGILTTALINAYTELHVVLECTTNPCTDTHLNDSVTHPCMCVNHL